jgi:S1-C subfamily serine protease
VDVAVLKLSGTNPAFVNRVEPDISHTNPGDEVIVIGYPLGLELLQWTKDNTAGPSLSTGLVSRVGHDFIQLNLRAYHGNSGGPVLNRKGEVIGILTANYQNAQDIALCTPISAALPLVGAAPVAQPSRERGNSRFGINANMQTVRLAVGADRADGAPKSSERH